MVTRSVTRCGYVAVTARVRCRRMARAVESRAVISGMGLRCSGQAQVASKGRVSRCLVPHLRLQLLEQVLDHDQLTRLLLPDIPNHHEPSIVQRHIVDLMLEI